jgi:hypothetical protein
MDMKKLKPSMKRLLVALGGAFLFRLPYWILQFRISAIQGFKPWDTDQHTWCIWDCNIYTQLGANYTPEKSAFFPLYPLLIKAASAILPPLGDNGINLLLCNALTLISGVLLLFLADGIWADENYMGSKNTGGGRKFFGFFYKSWLALLFLSIFPDGHFWMRGYSEPLFFALLMSVLLSVQKKKWMLVGLFTGLISISRPQGVWIAAVVGIFLLTRIRDQGRKPAVIVSWILTALPFACFMIWLAEKTGNPLYFYSVQTTGWGRKFDLIQGLKDHLPRWDVGHLYLYLSLFGAIRFLRRRGAATTEWRIIGLITLLLGDLPIYFGGFFSYVRFVSINPGLFLVTSELASENPFVAVAVVIWCLIRLTIQMNHSMTTWVG